MTSLSDSPILKKIYTGPHGHGKTPHNRIPEEIPDLTLLKRPIKIETIIDTVGSEFGCTREKILEKGRKGNLARDMAIYLARDLSGESAQRLGAYFGGISGAGITMRYKRMSERASRSRRLKGTVKKIRSQIVNI